MKERSEDISRGNIDALRFVSRTCKGRAKVKRWEKKEFLCHWKLDIKSFERSTCFERENSRNLRFVAIETNLNLTNLRARNWKIYSISFSLSLSLSAPSPPPRRRKQRKFRGNFTKLRGHSRLNDTPLEMELAVSPGKRSAALYYHFLRRLANNPRQELGVHGKGGYETMLHYIPGSQRQRDDRINRLKRGAPSSRQSISISSRQFRSLFTENSMHAT